MRRGAALRLVALALLVPSCRPNPYKKLRPHEALRAADEIYRAGHLPEAERVYELALEKAQRAELGVAGLKVYFDRLVQVTAEAGKLEAAETHLRGLESVSSGHWIGGAIRGAHNIAVLRYRRGELFAADHILAQLLQSVGSGTTGTEPKHEEFAMRMVLWMSWDRVHTAQGRGVEAAEAFRQAFGSLEVLGRWVGGRYWPLAPGVGAAAARYAAFLRGAGREVEARSIEAEARAIQERAPAPPDDEGACVTYLAEAPMGCFLEIVP